MQASGRALRARLFPCRGDGSRPTPESVAAQRDPALRLKKRRPRVRDVGPTPRSLPAGTKTSLRQIPEPVAEFRNPNNREKPKDLRRCGPTGTKRTAVYAFLKSLQPAWSFLNPH